MSQFLDKLETPCKFCVFADYDGVEQVGCKANQLTDYFSAYDEDKRFFVKKGVCLYYRPPTWNNGEPDVQKALTQIENAMTPSVLIDLNDQELILPDTLIKNIKIIGHASYNKSEEYKKNILKKASNYNSKGWTNLKISFVNDDNYFINLLMSISSHYLVVIKNLNSLSKIENAYNSIKYTYEDVENDIYGCMTFALKLGYNKDMDLIENIKFLHRQVNEHNITKK